MHVLITGAAGFLGQRLAKTLLERGEVDGRAVTRLSLVDRVAPAPPSHDTIRLDCRAMDITRPGALDSLLGERPEVI
ncbi:NAD-dependent epimerase/dehydratase family protein, partial [Modicisalibacter radicis]|uniref:NAD-dependent epimerase/dehydratase family protein n=1 Tax=Halomonas sp. EAR18 TaxID=2518972 RepID=UPI00109D49A7